MQGACAQIETRSAHRYKAPIPCTQAPLMQGACTWIETWNAHRYKAKPEQQARNLAACSQIGPPVHASIGLTRALA
eukprot:1159631-Pelagomonas_calceolata.AAC.13